MWALLALRKCPRTFETHFRFQGIGMDPDLFPTCKFEQTKVAWMNSKAPLQPHPLQDGGTRFTQSLPQSLTIKLISEAFLIAILLDHPWALEGPPAPAPTLATSSRDTSPPGRRTLWYTHSNTTIGAWGRSSWITVRMCRMQSHKIKCQHECRKYENKHGHRKALHFSYSCALWCRVTEKHLFRLLAYIGGCLLENC